MPLPDGSLNVLEGATFQDIARQKKKEQWQDMPACQIVGTVALRQSQCAAWFFLVGPIFKNTTPVLEGGHIAGNSARKKHSIWRSSAP